MGIKRGMYVRCPVDEEDPNNPRRFALGKVKLLDTHLNTVEVSFLDLCNIKNLFPNLNRVRRYKENQVIRVKIMPNSIVRYKLDKGKVMAFSHKNQEGYNMYYVQISRPNGTNIIKIPENELFVNFTDALVVPVTQLKSYEFHNPRWYLKRRKVSKVMNVLRNSNFGFEYLVGSRVHLLPHQVKTVVRVLNESKSRFILADEVGLGKTIEACAILKGLKEQSEKLNTLLIVPSSLVTQWKNELFYKFNINIDIWTPGKVISEDIIIPTEYLSMAVSMGLFRRKWGICIVDETHNLMKNETHYEIVMNISKSIEYLLLLSATPIQERRAEYLNLLKLLKPSIYENMTETSFENIIKKQNELQEMVYPLIEDLKNYDKDGEYIYYLSELNDIAEYLDDRIFTELVKNIDINSKDYGLKNVKLCLSYLSEYYQFERNVIRHRRKSVEIERPLANRTLIAKSYEMKGANTLFFEDNVYEQLKSFISLYIIKNSNNCDKEIMRKLLSAFFSSPWALDEVLSEIESISSAEEYKERLKELKRVTDQWKVGVIDEIERYKELSSRPYEFQGRLLHVLNYIKENCLNKKVVIFTQYTSTLKYFEVLLDKCFNKETYTSFYKGLDKDILQTNADKFQNENQCWFMLCDELGGEGRNFQIADKIIHIDLPWQVNKIEQRIGRLDRIGRNPEKDVLSVVFFTENSIEASLFKIWSEVLDVFNSSLSALEIILEELNDKIVDALYKDLNYGLLDAMVEISSIKEKMNKQIAREKYYDIAAQLDDEKKNYLYNMIENFNENSGKQLRNIMMAWANMVGFRPSNYGEEDDILVFKPESFSYKSAKNTYFRPPFESSNKHRLDSYNSKIIRGTFNRSLAIVKEDLSFFSPGNIVFDNIIENAIKSDLGQCTALALETDFYFKGFVFTWSINPDIRRLLDLNESIVYLNKFRNYLAREQVITVIPIDKESENLKFYKHKVINVLDKESKHSRAFHLGKRNDGNNPSIINTSIYNNLSWFKQHYTTERWHNIINSALKKSKEEVRKHIRLVTDIHSAKYELGRIAYARKISNKYFANETNDNTNLVEIHKAILKGVNSQIGILDSVAFVWMVNKND